MLRPLWLITIKDKWETVFFDKCVSEQTCKSLLLYWSVGEDGGGFWARFLFQSDPGEPGISGVTPPGPLPGVPSGPSCLFLLSLFLGLFLRFRSFRPPPPGSEGSPFESRLGGRWGCWGGGGLWGPGQPGWGCWKLLFLKQWHSTIFKIATFYSLCLYHFFQKAQLAPNKNEHIFQHHFGGKVFHVLSY